MATTFEESLSAFREFLRSNGYPENVAWVEPQDILLTGRRIIYVRTPIPNANEQNVRRLFERSQSKQTGILFETICATPDMTYAFAWMPANSDEAQRRLIGSGLKMSANTGLSEVPGRTVRSRLRWVYLSWVLRGKQQMKDYLFS